jgi:hypothetical protein
MPISGYKLAAADVPRQTEKPDVDIHNPDTAGAVVRAVFRFPLDPKGRMKKGRSGLLESVGQCDMMERRNKIELVDDPGYT